MYLKIEKGKAGPQSTQEFSLCEIFVSHFVNLCCKKCFFALCHYLLS